MKKAILTATIAVLLCAATQAGATTFTEWDKMTFEQQSDFIAERAYTIQQWLVKNEPAKAKCMARTFTPEPGEKISRAPEKNRSPLDKKLPISGYWPLPRVRDRRSPDSNLRG